MTAVIHHNPKCGTSRNTLKMIEASGEDMHVVEYLETGWTRPQLLALFAGAELTPRSALRISKSPAEELGLTDPSVSDETPLIRMEMQLNYSDIYRSRSFLAFFDIECHLVAFIQGFEPGRIDT